MKYTLTFLAALASLTAHSAASPAKRDDFSDQALSLHNTNRARYGANPLKYRTKIAKSAAAYAAKCVWGHSGAEGYGENLAAGSGDGFNIQDAVQLWMGEAAQYNFDLDYQPGTGHFTQVVWKSTTAVGCGIKRCTTGSPFGSGDWTNIVCQYSPQGNVIGQFIDNVGRPT